MNEALTLLFSMIGNANGVADVQNWFDRNETFDMHIRESDAFFATR